MEQLVDFAIGYDPGLVRPLALFGLCGTGGAKYVGAIYGGDSGGWPSSCACGWLYSVFEVLLGRPYDGPWYGGGADT